MSEFRFILGRRALIVSLALLVVTGAFLGAPAATPTLADSPPSGSQEVSAASADLTAADGLIHDPSGTSPLLQGGSGTGTWTLVPTTPLSPSAPSVRSYHAMAATPSGVLLFGGYFWDGSHEYRFSDTWLFNTTSGTWSQLTIIGSSPSARSGHVMAATPSGDVLLFGGQDTSGLRNDTWLFNATSGTWGLLNTGSTSAPSARFFPAMAATPWGVLLFGGSNVGGYPSDTWLFTYDGTGTGTWSQLTITGSSPSGRQVPAMAATPSGDVLLFGGTTGSGGLNDSWLFTYDGVSKIGAWTETNTPINVINTPAGRAGHAMAATPWGVLLFGGQGISGRYSDTWLFTNDGVSKTGTWTNRSPASSPSTRSNHAMAYDSQSGKVILFGGYGGPVYFGDTWLYGPMTSVPTLHLSSPVGGEDWIRGHTYPISWTSTGVTGTTTIELSRDNGVTWETLTTTTATSGTFLWTVTTPRTSQALVRVSGSGQSDQSPAVFRLRDPQISLLSPVGEELWAIGSNHLITWTATDLDGTTLAILLARNGVDFTETLTIAVDASSGSWNWTVTGPGTINARVQVVEADCQDSSPNFFTISTPYIYSGAPITTTDPWLEISGGSGTGTLWATPLTPTNTSDPNLGRFIFDTGKRAALFFDISQEGLSGTLTIVLHYTSQLGEETFALYLWNGTGWVEVPGTLNLEDHTFTFSIDTALLMGTAFALGGDPVAMPGMSPWGLVLLSLALLGMGEWWFVRRRRLA